MYPQDYYFSDFIALLVEINTELTKISERYSYDPKGLFKKVKVVMMAVRTQVPVWPSADLYLPCPSPAEERSTIGVSG